MTIEEIKPLEAWNLLKENQNSILVDVRTIPEFNFVGTADLTKINQDPILLPWRNYPNMEIDGDFNNKLMNILEQKNLNQDKEGINLLFICRSGARSLEAANSTSDLGYHCYNVIDGLEGDVDKAGHRGNINGWKAAELPWRQN